MAATQDPVISPAKQQAETMAGAGDRTTIANVVVSQSWRVQGEFGEDQAALEGAKNGEV